MRWDLHVPKLQSAEKNSNLVGTDAEINSKEKIAIEVADVLLSLRKLKVVLVARFLPVLWKESFHLVGFCLCIKTVRYCK